VSEKIKNAGYSAVLEAQKTDKKCNLKRCLISNHPAATGWGIGKISIKSEPNFFFN
jgi:hypothetical protein